MCWCRAAFFTYFTTTTTRESTYPVFKEIVYQQVHVPRRAAKAKASTHKRELLPCHSHKKSSFHTTVKSARPRNGVCQSKAQVRSRIHVHLNLMLQCIGRGRNARNGTFSPPPPPPPFLFGFEHLESPSNVIHLSGLVLHIPAWRRS